ncbi:MAG: hypothetical protein QG604_413 [Candidatus Dependentiae bacterium]|nr:hypothetical protein [Candidatus Dependentiae bacterium]
MNPRSLVLLYLMVLTKTMECSTTEPAPTIFIDKAAPLSEAEFNVLLENPDQRRSSNLEHIVHYYDQFRAATTTTPISLDNTPHFLNAIWHSGLSKEQVLGAAKQVEPQLNVLTKKNPKNLLLAHLNNALKKHPNKTDLIALKRQYSRVAPDDYRSARSINQRLFHNPGPATAILGLGSALGVGWGLRTYKKQKRETELMTLHRHVLRHRVLQKIGYADPSRLQSILNDPTAHLSPEKKELIERFLKVEIEYKKRNKEWLQAVGSAAAGGVGLMAASQMYQNRTPLKAIE